MSSNEKCYFTIVGGSIMKLTGKYKVAIYSHGYGREEKFDISIISSDEEFKESKRVTISGTNMQILEFELNIRPNINYNLNVSKATSGYHQEIRSLHLNLKKYSIFIQTDKSVYKPADNVKFRVFILDAETKPFKFDSIEIFIKDGGENRVKQYENVSKNFIKGVYQNELQLSDSPVMGAWKIHVKVNGEDETVKSFDVDEYVLPKFEVTIDTNPNVLYKDDIIRATVKAKYTFGKLAKGNATVTAIVDSSYHRHPPSDKVSKTVEVDGKKSVEFDIKKDLGIKDQSHEHYVTLKATFKDTLSGKEATASTKVKVRKLEYKMELKKSAEKFKPGLPFRVTAILMKFDKTPVNDEKNPIHFTIIAERENSGDDYESSEEKTHEIKKFPVNGIAEIDIDVHKDTTCFTIKAKYLNLEEEIRRVHKIDSKSDQYIQIKVFNEKPCIQENIKIEVLSTNTISHLAYTVVVNGGIQDSKLEKFESTKRHIFEIKPTISMLPFVHVVVHYLTSDGEIVSDKVKVEFENQLMNHIDLNLSSEQAKPGENLTISVNTRPNSFVGLLGVDQSVLLLKKGNDIEHETVFGELNKYSNIDKHNRTSYSRHDSGDFYNLVLVTNMRKIKEEREDRVRSYACDSRNSFRPNLRMRSAMAEPIARNFQKQSQDTRRQFRLKGGGPAPPKPIEIRKTFPETFIFDNLEFGSNGTKILTKKVPDTITSWIITGFSLDPVTGLGLTKQPSKLNVFQPFFVSTNLPYSIKRGEVVTIPIIVYNYLESDQDTIVTLFNKDGEFEFVDTDGNEENAIKKLKIGPEFQRTKEVVIKSEDGITVPFMIRPLKAGHITIKVTAESPMAGDGVERPLKVEPEGVTQYLNEAILIDLRSCREFKRTINIVIPQEAVPDSTKIEASAIGDILGPSIENLDKLIKLPNGCGEQNMLNFVPNIVVLDYLTNLKILNPQIESKAIKYMETGYQRELTYKHNDGSYSAFGKYDKSGSTWLTAFVAKSFNQAAKYINIDPYIVLAALNFLKSVQAKDGSFPEVGNICHRDMQGGSSKGIALTAYTLITFLENKELGKKFEDVITKALDYITDNLESLEDTYSLSIANYALQLAGHELKDSILSKLDKKANNKDGMKYWTKEIEIPKKDEKVSWWHKPSSVNVEMSAYALLSFIEADQDIEAVPIMKWLVSQRNENGGFQSTQDTVVGLQSLSKLAAKIHVADSDLRISVKSEQSNPATININSGNSLVLQKHELPSNAESFEVSATGKGLCVLQISYKYNLDDSGKFPRFELTPKVDSTSNKEFLFLRVSTRFIPDLNVSISNMAVMEVSLPSGFTYDTDQLAELMATTNVKKVETKDGDTVIMVYFDDIGADEICPEFKAYRTHAVAEQKPAPVIIYDYYDNSRCARTFYDPPRILISDIVAI